MLPKYWYQKFNTETLDEIRLVVGASLERQRKYLDQEHEDYADFGGDTAHEFTGYQNHLEERWLFTKEVAQLCAELTVVALFRQVELHLKHVTAKMLPSVNAAKFSNVQTLLLSLPFVSTLPDFAAFDELRLLNNCIKHQGTVSQALAQKFPAWKLHAELSGLDAAYDRLLPSIKRFVSDFVDGCDALKPPSPRKQPLLRM